MNKKINNGIFYVVISLIAVLAVCSVGYAYSVSQTQYIETYNNYEAEGTVEGDVSLGAFPGGDIYAPVNIHDTFQEGGGRYLATTTEETAITLTQRDLENYKYIDLLVNGGSNFAYTLPATSTMMMILPEIGSTREWLFHHATSTGAYTFTMTAGAGMDLVAVTNADDVIDPGEWMRLQCTHIYYRDDTDENIMCIVDELLDAD